MFFARSQAKKKLKDAIAQFPITILATPAGSGKSRLIDSVFEKDGDVDIHSCVLVRFDERVSDLDTFARYFAVALQHQMPDDVNPYEFILEKVRVLPPGFVIIVDDLHTLHGQTTALKLISRLVEDAGTFEKNSGRRWLFGTRDATDLPYALWHARGMCITISSRDELALQDEDFSLLRRTLSLPETAKVSTNVRDSVLRFSTLRLCQEFPQFSVNPKKYKASESWMHDCDPQGLGQNCICGLETLASSEESRTETADPNAFHKNHNESKPLGRTCRLYGSTADVFHCLSLLEKDIADDILSCALLYDLDVDFLCDSLPRIEVACAIMRSLDLAYLDIASGRVRLDRIVRNALLKILSQSPEHIIERATRIACSSGFNGADVSRGLSLLINRKMWDSASTILSDFGLDLFERDQVNGIVSRTLSAFPEEIRIDSPIVSGLLGVVTSRVNYSDISESHFKCALENESFVGPFRGVIHYRYVLEVTRRRREETPELLRELLEYVYSEPEDNQNLKALTHSLAAYIESTIHPEIALGHIERAMSALTNITDPFAIARVLRDCSAAFNCLGEYEQAITTAKSALRLAIENGFYDLASRVLSTLQDLSYRYEHNLPLAQHYLEVMTHYAQRAGESRMILLSWLCRYWLFIESGHPDEVQSSHENIDRYTMPDDFMQSQIKSCTVPGSAMKNAWQGRFTEAISLVESYAIHETDPEDRAFRWSELCIYFAAQFALTGDPNMEQGYNHALAEALASLLQIDGDILQEGNINLRIAIGHIVMGELYLAKNFIPYFESLEDRDRRAPAMREMIIQLIDWNDELGQGKKFGDAKRNLFANDLGGIALLIDALPLRMNLQSA